MNDWCFINLFLNFILEVKKGEFLCLGENKGLFRDIMYSSFYIWIKVKILKERKLYKFWGIKLELVVIWKKNLEL